MQHYLVGFLYELLKYTPRLFYIDFGINVVRVVIRQTNNKKIHIHIYVAKWLAAKVQQYIVSYS